MNETVVVRLDENQPSDRLDSRASFAASPGPAPKAVAVESLLLKIDEATLRSLVQEDVDALKLKVKQLEGLLRILDEEFREHAYSPDLRRRAIFASGG